jgi:hypothetical protein
MPGIVTSPVEVAQITPFGVWLVYYDRVFFLDHDLFPWFKKASVEKIFNVREEVPGHFYWPDLDVDLDIERIEHPERYPLVARIDE